MKAEAIPGEQWKPIPGYEGSYEASNMGRIRSVDRIVPAANGTPQRRFSQVLRLRQGDKYLDVMLAQEGRKRVKVHVMVALAFLGAPPPGYEVNHKNRIRTDNRAENLEYVTHAENIRHAKMSGVRNNTKLTPANVREIRRLRKAGLKQVAIADRFGVTETCVWAVLSGRSWSYVD